MNSIKASTLLSFFLMCILSVSQNAHASGDVCWVKTAVDVTRDSTRYYGNSIRAQFETLETNSTHSCKIDPIYLDDDTTDGEGFVPKDSSGNFPTHWIWVDTTKVLGSDGTDNGIHVDKITFKEALNLDVKNYTLFGNASYYAAKDVADTSKLIDKNNINRDAQYTFDALTILSNPQPYDAGLVTLDFRTNFKNKDFQPANTEIDDEGNPKAPSRVSDIDWSQFPIQCDASSKPVALWNTVILLPDSFYSFYRNNSYELKKVIFDQSRPETACLVDFGANYVCVGERTTNSDGSYVDPSTQASGDTISQQNKSWCDAKTLDNSIPRKRRQFWPDVDQDGFGATEEGVFVDFNALDIPVDKHGNPYILIDGDCDDGEDAAFPGNPEVCDGIDNDCNGIVDDVSTGSCDKTFFEDNDGDGVGGNATTVDTGITIGGDCDDSDANAFPGNPEVCDGVDNDCNGIVDDISIGSCEEGNFYDDLDGDGFGDDSTAHTTADSNDVIVGGDCDDTSASINPSAIEVCGNSIDENCDGVDDVCTIFYDDADGDGFGDESTAHNTVDSNDVTVGGDCDDTNPARNPGAVEICGNSIDENCDGVDDVCTIFYDDADGDGFGDESTAHDVSSGTDVLISGDCDDTNPEINPDALELCAEKSVGNGIDENCNGLVDETCVIEVCDDGIDNDNNGLQDCDDTESCDCTDADGDGYTVADGDCDDTKANIHPEATEFCNLDNIDFDCDGVVNDDNICIDGDVNPNTVPGTGFIQADGGSIGGCSLNTTSNSQHPTWAWVSLAISVLYFLTVRRRALK